MLSQWREVVANRPFLLFSVAVIGSYVLSFQAYLALLLEVRRLGGEGESGTVAVALLFAVSGLSTILGQTKVTAWCKARMEPGRALTWGLPWLALLALGLACAAALYGLHRTGRLAAVQALRYSPRPPDGP
ncbi:hypothetical protein SVIO_065230 [Streptomyces violaceusniger]|uniref:Uncharacterized protein n=1 Tax=Streptomyces violaceusniger TaxID=68280 RepID=A0A4D4LA44_STRVO|nr:hypothetical protein SVIO_065230 [Streptomyces violaceusniger]